MEKGTRVEQIADGDAAPARRRRRGRLLPAVRLSRARRVTDIERTLRDGARAARRTTSACRCRIRCRARPSIERVQAQLGQKQNWVDSNDLAMMYHATYVPDFYRALHALVHARVPRAEIGRASSRAAPPAVDAAAAARARGCNVAYQSVKTAVLQRRLGRLARLTAPAPPTPLIPLLTPQAAAVPTDQSTLK